MINFELSNDARELKLVIPGDLLSTNYDTVGSEVSAVFSRKEVDEKPWSVLVLDLRGARLIDSMGLNLIVGLVKQVNLRKGKIRALITSRTIHRTFLFTRLEKHMEIVFEDKNGDSHA